MLNAKKWDATSQVHQPDGLAANGGDCDRIPLWRASINGKITPSGPGIWGIFRFLAFVAAVLLVSPLSGVFAGSAATSEGDEPAQPASFVTWHTDNFFTQCDGNCAVSVFGGPQLLTHQYDIFVHFKPAWEWRLGNTDLFGGAISRRLLTLWDSLDIESEFGLAKRFGNMHTEEAWLVLNFRWTRFPWNQYLRTSIAITSGPSFAANLPMNTHHNATVLNYFSPEITFALPQYPQYELMVQMHHRSNIVDFGKGGDPRSWLAISDSWIALPLLNPASRPGKRLYEGISGSEEPEGVD